MPYSAVLVLAVHENHGLALKATVLGPVTKGLAVIQTGLAGRGGLQIVAFFVHAARNFVPVCRLFAFALYCNRYLSVLTRQLGANLYVP